MTLRDLDLDQRALLVPDHAGYNDPINTATRRAGQLNHDITTMISSAVDPLSIQVTAQGLDRAPSLARARSELRTLGVDPDSAIRRWDRAVATRNGTEIPAQGRIVTDDNLAILIQRARSPSQLALTRLAETIGPEPDAAQRETLRQRVADLDTAYPLGPDQPSLGRSTAPTVAFDLDGYRELQRHLHPGDSGQLRTYWTQNKRGDPLCLPDDIQAEAARIFADLRAVPPGLSVEDFADTVTAVAWDLHYLDPFTVGDGETEAVLLTQWAHHHQPHIPTEFTPQVDQLGPGDYWRAGWAGFDAGTDQPMRDLIISHTTRLDPETLRATLDDWVTTTDRAVELLGTIDATTELLETGSAMVRSAVQSALERQRGLASELEQRLITEICPAIEADAMARGLGDRHLELGHLVNDATVPTLGDLAKGEQQRLIGAVSQYRAAWGIEDRSHALGVRDTGSAISETQRRHLNVTNGAINSAHHQAATLKRSTMTPVAAGPRPTRALDLGGIAH